MSDRRPSGGSDPYLPSGSSQPLGGRSRLGLLLLVAGLATVLAVAPLWRIRARTARVSRRLPDAIVPTPLSVLPPPDAEYAGVWDVPPETARRRLVDDHGFGQQIRAYLHAYERDGVVRYEAASCAYRPDGFTGAWQLHVRLFPTGTGATDVWCHWERNPNVSPIAHLRQDGYDPAEGIARFRELVSDPVRPPETGGPVAERGRPHPNGELPTPGNEDSATSVDGETAADD